MPSSSPYRLTDIKIYGDFGDNPALNEVAIGPRMRTLVSGYGHAVREIWDGSARLGTGRNIASATVDTYIGGYDKKRWVSEVTAHTDYAAADELGRHKYNPYPGSHALRNALHSVLPTEI